MCSRAIGYVEKATKAEKKDSRNFDQGKEDFQENRRDSFLKKVLISLFFYFLSFIASFVPVMVECYFKGLNDVSQYYDNVLSVDFWVSCLFKSFENIGTVYISISLLFVLLLDLIKNVVIKNCVLRSNDVFIILVETVLSVLGLIIFCLMMGSIAILSDLNTRLSFVPFTYLYLALVIVAVIVNLCIENRISSAN